LEGILHDQTLQVAGLEARDQDFAGVEADKLYLAAGEPGVAEGLEHSGRGGFVDREDAVDLRAEAVEQIFRTCLAVSRVAPAYWLVEIN